jgi:hypothetical protein
MTFHMKIIIIKPQVNDQKLFKKISVLGKKLNYQFLEIFYYR